MAFSELLKKAPFMGAFFVCVFFALPARAQCPAPAGLEWVTVKRVVDGDTVLLSDQRRVRLIGINTPELAGRGRDDEPFAQSARLRLQALINAGGGRLGIVAGHPAQDHYGRMLAHLYDSSGRNLEALLLAEGLGYQVVFSADGWSDCLRAAEDEARAARRGLWLKPQWLKAENVSRSGFALVRGKLSAVQRNHGGLWLEFGAVFVVRIEPANLKHFDEVTLRRTVGREVEVRGWIIDRSRGFRKPGQTRWLLPLTHPSMLSLSRDD